jgi:hypothetical protein
MCKDYNSWLTAYHGEIIDESGFNAGQGSGQGSGQGRSSRNISSSISTKVMHISTHTTQSASTQNTPPVAAVDMNHPILNKHRAAILCQHKCLYPDYKKAVAWGGRSGPDLLINGKLNM